MLAVVRFVVLCVIAILVLSAVIAIARPETGAIEKAALVVAGLALLAAAEFAHRIGTGPASS